MFSAYVKLDPEGIELNDMLLKAEVVNPIVIAVLLFC